MRIGFGDRESHGDTTEAERGEEEFTRRMNDLVLGGVDFQSIVKDTLLESLGETPSAILLGWLSKGALNEPSLFYREISRRFTGGSKQICNLVIARAEEVTVENESGPRAVDEPDTFEAITKDLGPTSQQLPSLPSVMSRWRSEERFALNDPYSNKLAEQFHQPSKANGLVSFRPGEGFVLDVETWRKMKTGISSEKQGNLVGRIWYEYGRSLGERLYRVMGRASDLILRSVEETSEESGWGKLKIEGNPNYGTNLRARVENCAFCRASATACTLQGECEFVGLLKGVSESVYGTREVTRMGALGDRGTVCEFVMEKTVR